MLGESLLVQRELHAFTEASIIRGVLLSKEELLRKALKEPAVDIHLLPNVKGDICIRQTAIEWEDSKSLYIHLHTTRTHILTTSTGESRPKTKVLCSTMHVICAVCRKLRIAGSHAATARLAIMQPTGIRLGMLAQDACRIRDNRPLPVRYAGRLFDRDRMRFGLVRVTRDIQGPMITPPGQPGSIPTPSAQFPTALY